MYILLEPGMRINQGDEAYHEDEWEIIDGFVAGKSYTEDHFPMRRKIESLEELFASYNSN